MLDGDGSFRSDEITRFRDSADFVITNPPFSLFREFISWVVEGDNISFSLITNKNCVTYKEVFPLIKDNKLWSGRTEWSGGMWFKTVDENNVDKVIHGINMKNISSFWATNIKHKKLFKPLNLIKTYMPEEYLKYDNYDAIEVSRTKDIPTDYTGVMGVPISFLDKYCPEQFDIIGITKTWDNSNVKTSTKHKDGGIINGKIKYARILIKHKKPLAQN